GVMQNGIYRVLFLSRRNSARSVMAEAILNKIGKGRFEAVSAAVDPAPVIEPTVLELLRTADYPMENITPRHFGAFADAGAANL
ncbi:arsenate reductase ArsC, partial [Burkholderia sp. SIMBA_013]